MIKSLSFSVSLQFSVILAGNAQKEHFRWVFILYSCLIISIVHRRKNKEIRKNAVCIQNEDDIGELLVDNR